MNKYGIEEEIFELIIDTFKSINEIENVVLFGSRAKGTFKRTSDIDLAVQFTDGEKKQLLMRKLDEMRCALKFDVLDIRKIENEKLLYNIRNEGKTIYQK